MGITIIIDKSTFQSLNYDEIMLVSRYFKHNITPVLTMEILGDLKKEFEEGKKPSEERVIDFANKLFPINTVVNMHYQHLVIGDLMGDLIEMDGRPILHIEKTVQSDSGQKGWLIKESTEEKSIQKWKGGKFSEADYELSEYWRVSTTQEKLLENLKRSLKNENALKFPDFNQLDHFTTDAINTPDIQQFLLIFLLEQYGIDAATAVQIFGRWTQMGKPLIKDFSPYAYHCLRVDSLFLFGLASGLITTRPTNRVDMEYLYYLPFCNAFTSNDKIHKNIAPLLISSNQKFIIGSDLKEDYKQISEYLNKLSLEDKRNFNTNPPIIEQSLTFGLWKEFYGYPKPSNWNRKISEDEFEKMKLKMKEFESAVEGENILGDNYNDADFIVMKSYMSKNDPCYCGSGKRVIDCCIPEDKFNKLALEDMMRQNIKNKNEEK